MTTDTASSQLCTNCAQVVESKGKPSIFSDFNIKDIIQAQRAKKYRPRATKQDHAVIDAWLATAFPHKSDQKGVMALARALYLGEALPYAVVFSGPKGTGKFTTLNVLMGLMHESYAKMMDKEEVLDYNIANSDYRLIYTIMDYLPTTFRISPHANGGTATMLILSSYHVPAVEKNRNIRVVNFEHHFDVEDQVVEGYSKRLTSALANIIACESA